MNELTHILYQNIIQDMLFERIIYTYSYLSLLLYHIPTGKEWKQKKEFILNLIQSARFGFGNLPFLNISNRTTTLKERKKQMENLNRIIEFFPYKKKWYEIFLAKQYISQNHLRFFIEFL